jgi:uncharacterized protein
MPAAHDVHSPLADLERRELEKLVGECCSFGMEGVLGLMHAVAVGPSRVAPASWTTTVLAGAPPMDDAALVRAFLLLMRLYNEVSVAIGEHHPIVPPDGEAELCKRFAEGYLAGAELDSTWRDDEDAWALAGPFALLCGQRELVPARMLAARDADPASGDAIRKQMAHLVVEAEARFRDARAQPPRRRAAKPAKPGRNEPCPCGSGKKHKKCCAA